MEEQKCQFESQLKNAKTNEKLLYGEMEHLRKAAELYEKQTVPEKDKEISKLTETVKNVHIRFLFYSFIHVKNL